MKKNDRYFFNLLVLLLFAIGSQMIHAEVDVLEYDEEPDKIVTKKKDEPTSVMSGFLEDFISDPDYMDVITVKNLGLDFNLDRMANEINELLPQFTTRVFKPHLDGKAQLSPIEIDGVRFANLKLNRAQVDLLLDLTQPSSFYSQSNLSDFNVNFFQKQMKQKGLSVADPEYKYQKNIHFHYWYKESIHKATTFTSFYAERKCLENSLCKKIEKQVIEQNIKFMNYKLFDLQNYKSKIINCDSLLCVTKGVFGEKEGIVILYAYLKYGLKFSRYMSPWGVGVRGDFDLSEELSLDEMAHIMLTVKILEKSPKFNSLKIFKMITGFYRFNQKLYKIYLEQPGMSELINIGLDGAILPDFKRQSLTDKIYDIAYVIGARLFDEIETNLGTDFKRRQAYIDYFYHTLGWIPLTKDVKKSIEKSLRTSSTFYSDCNYDEFSDCTKFTYNSNVNANFMTVLSLNYKGNEYYQRSILQALLKGQNKYTLNGVEKIITENTNINLYSPDSLASITADILKNRNLYHPKTDFAISFASYLSFPEKFKKDYPEYYNYFEKADFNFQF